MSEHGETPITAEAVQTIVGQEFGWLIARGYKLSATESGGAMLSDGRVTLIIELEATSYYLRVRIRAEATNEVFGLYSAFPQYAGHAIDIGGPGRYVDTYRESVRRTSMTCQRYLYAALTGDNQALAETLEVARAATRAYNNRARFGPLLAKADEAWHKQDWRKALELYEAAKEGLPATEERRRDYLLAKKAKGLL